MKRVLGISALVLVITLSGCGKAKTIECSKNNSIDGASNKLILKLDGSKVSKVDEKMIFSDAATANTYYESVKDIYKNVSIDHYTVTSVFKGDEINNRIIVNNNNKDTIVNELKNQGYKCE